MARILILNLGKPILETIINSLDPQVSYVVIETISQLRVQNDQIKLYLEKLTEYNRPERVRKLAEKTLSEIKGHPDWPSNLVRQD